MDIKDLKKSLDEAQTEVKNLVERQSGEIKSLGEASAETLTEIKSANDRIEELEKKAGRMENSGAKEVKSAGQIFVESDQFKSAQSRGQNTVDAVEMKDITSASGSAGAVALSERRQGIIRDPADRMVHIRDLINVQQTSSGSIDYYVDYTGFTNNAASQNGELTAKAKSELVLEEKTASVKTLAHYFPASRQVLEDAPMLRSYIDGRLAYGLKVEEDRQILYGDGTAGTLTGIMNTVGVQDVGDRAATDDFMTHIRKAITKARLSNYQVDGVIVNPEDWETIELMTDDNGNYIYLQYLNTNGTPKLFRVPVIESNAIEQGDFIVGNWSLAATLWDRQVSNVRVSDSHADLFIKNGVVILGEERVALTVDRPSAFVKGSFNEAV